jgi:hypothetical protein
MTNKLPQVEHAGTYLAVPVAWGLKKFDSLAVKVWIAWRITAAQSEEGWASYADYAPVGVNGDVFIAKKGGAVSLAGVEQLKNALGWNGDLRAFLQKPPEIEAQIDVRPDANSTDGYLKVQWVRARDASTTRAGNEDEIADLERRMGSAFRAAASDRTPALRKPQAGSPAPSSARPPTSAPKPSERLPEAGAPMPPLPPAGASGAPLVDDDTPY